MAARIPLEKLVVRVVDKWSIDYLQRAKLGETEAMVQVAEIMFTQRGWGQIAYNPAQARRWLESAAAKGDPFAAFALRNITKIIEQRHEAAKQVQRYQIGNLENPKLGFNVDQKISEMTGSKHRTKPLPQDYTKAPKDLTDKKKRHE
eukprot:UN01199